MIGVAALACTAEPASTAIPTGPVSERDPTADPGVAVSESDKTPVTPAAPTSAPLAAPPVVPPMGCWEREFGTPPAGNANTPSLPAAVPGCVGCEQLRVGPKAVGLHVEVLRRVQSIVESLPPPPIDEPVLWLNSGARQGDRDDSMHNQALGIDAVICGLDTRATAKRLRDAGFTCVIEYYDGAGNPCHFAHADLRATSFAQGAYAKGGRKARSCPKRAASRTMNCDNSIKRDWTYSEG